MRYRRTVLEPGATKPATELVKDFLGRPQNIDALKQWMNVEFETPGAATLGASAQK
jgi:thimet oligopeptidase